MALVGVPSGDVMVGGSATLYVAVSRFRVARHNAKGNHGASVCHLVGLLHRSMQCLLVGDDMVCGHHKQDRILPIG